ncbi:MAG: glutamate ABC transporter substrate-binding protein [Acidimicrobiia bacterium]
MTARRRMVALVGALLALSLVVASCDDGGSSAERGPTSGLPETTVTTAPSVPAAPDCGNPVASFSPLSPMPAPGNMPPGYLTTIQQRGRLIAGVSADTLLFGYFNPLTGKLEGFDIDLVREVADAIFGDPNRVEYKVVTYAQRIPSLLDGSVDIIADVMTVNCERWAQISFSSQYFDAGQKILVRADSPVTGISQLDGKRMCAARGSTNIDNLANYPKVVVVPVDDISDCMVLFQQGAVDSVTGDDTVLAGFVAQDPYAKIVGPALTSEPYGLGVAKSHPELVRFVNGVLADLRDNGTWSEMYRTWLQPPGAAPPPPVAVYGRTP